MKILNLNLDYLDKNFDVFAYLPFPNDKGDVLLGVGSKRELKVQNPGNSFNQLNAFVKKAESYLFGFFSYDLKNEVENLKSENSDDLEFPLMFFFEPELFLRISKDSKVVERIGDIEIDEKKLFAEQHVQTVSSNFSFKSRISKDEYLAKVQKLRSHIKRGDIYEVNYCQEYYCEKANMDPSGVFNLLTGHSEAPFQAFFKVKDKYAMCGSPERYLKKNGNKLISQPIKGTAGRSADPQIDAELKYDLQNSIKERAENVMIVDLVRNDLSRTAKKGSVKVDELFGIYSFKSVHQMISTISSELKEGCEIVDPIRYSFPMGSMTGAPKVRAMELIEAYEETKRGLYSGSIGYIKPNGDFDFNVVIRTVLYNQTKQYLSAMVGGAITYQSDPEKEYEECLTKIQPIFDTFKG